MAKQPKTNAMRMLDRARLAYTMHSYDPGDGHNDGVSVAAKTGRDPAQVYKTLVTRGHSGGIYVFVIPVAAELDLKKAAHAAGEKSVAMAPLTDLLPLTGYVRGGCSPVGMKKPYPTFFQQGVEELPTLLVSGGRVGTQIETAPGPLLELLGARTAPLTQDQGEQE